MKSTIHIIANGKGGIGKSFISSITAQYLKDKKKNVICIDTDPNNTTLAAIKELKAKFLNIMDGDNINIREFDKLVELTLSDPKSDYVIDSGATTFLPLIEYLKEGEILALLKDSFEIVFHIPIVGGQAQETTISGFLQIVDMFENITKFVVWVNPYHGLLDIKLKDGKSSKDIEDHNEVKELYKSEKAQNIIQINLPIVNVALTGKDLEQMTKLNYTFEQINNSPEFNIVSKSRLKKYKDDVYQSLEQFL
jgi:hypothetical protein